MQWLIVCPTPSHVLNQCCRVVKWVREYKLRWVKMHKNISRKSNGNVDCFWWPCVVCPNRINTLRPRHNGRHFADDIFNRIFLNENIWIPIKISLKFVPRGSINNIPALVQIMVWRRPGDKPLSEPMMVNLPTHICVTRPQWVRQDWGDSYQRMAFL